MTDTLKPARTRFAPSPTGFVHIGGLRTVLFSWLWARHTNGQFLLRIEDTDRKRYVEGAEDQIIESLQSVGMTWDEGPVVGGPHAPYRQSERLDLYHTYAAELEASGATYRSYASSEEIKALDAERTAQDKPRLSNFEDLPGIDSQARAAAGEPYTLRLRLRRDGQTVLQDAVRGEIVFDNAQLSMPDPVLLKSDGFPTYALAAMVDDHVMGITHVLRGEEWIASSPVHIQILEALGWEQPVWLHVPVVMGPDGKKFSKRHGDTAVNEYVKAGFLPEAILNYLALLGWSFDDKTEIMNLNELIERFDLTRIKPSPAVFDRDKLIHFNGVYIRELDVQDLATRVQPYLVEAGLVSSLSTDAEMQRLVEVLPLVQERLKLLSEAPEVVDFFFVRPEYADLSLFIPKKAQPEDVQRVLQAARQSLELVETWDVATIETQLRSLMDSLGMKPGQVFMPIRVAVCGRKESPGLFDTLVAVGKEETLVRLDNATQALSQLLTVSEEEQ